MEKMNEQVKRAVPMAVLFDFDGVIMDTETQYTVFWNEQGIKHLNDETFGIRIKGQTLTQIYQRFFADRPDIQQQITEELNRFEKEMAFEYIPGVVDFIQDLRCHGVPMAVVTSSNEVKMANVYRAHPELKSMFDYILTGEMFTRSKPAPECFQLGMKLLEVLPSQTYVFEDSFFGIEAGVASGATVIGLSTTNPREALEDKVKAVIPDFTEMTFDKLQTL